MNLMHLLRETARRAPAQIALVDLRAGASWTYGELVDRIDRVAGQLERGGVRDGSTVGLHVPSGADYIVLNYAVWKCGGCVVPVPTELAQSEKQEICRQIALDFVISQPPAPRFVMPFAARGGRVLDMKIGLVPIEPLRTHPREFQAVNAAFIRFTSGTTGDFKGVVLSHETIRDRIDAANEVLRVNPSDRVIWVLSMSYHFAVSIVAYLTFGAGIVLPPNHLAAGMLEAAGQHRGTFLYGSPAHFAWLAQAANAPPLPHLRLAISTTASLSCDIAREFHERFAVPITQALGIIEVGLPCINTRFAAERPSSVGNVLPAYELRLDDAALGRRTGEIFFRGPGFLDAYYHPWRERYDILDDGWFRTGDIGELDSDDCLYIRGRAKDVINVLGAKFFPQEVEQVLLSHPAVREAAVFAQPDLRLGEVPVARVATDREPGTALRQELFHLCRQRLADFKRPQRIEFVSAVPRTASGKILHRPVPEGAPSS